MHILCIIGCFGIRAGFVLEFAPRQPRGLHAGAVYIINGNQEKAWRHHRQILQGIIKALAAWQEDAHRRLRGRQRKAAEQRRQRQPNAEAQPHDPAHGGNVLRSPVLAEKDAAPRPCAKQEQLEHKHIASGLRHRRIGRIAQLTDHHPVDDVQGRRQQVLNHNGQADHQ